MDNLVELLDEVFNPQYDLTEKQLDSLPKDVKQIALNNA